MFDFRQFADSLNQSDDMLQVTREVDPRFELPALLKQAEARGEAIRFENVEGSPFPVVGGLFTSPARFARSLALADVQHVVVELVVIND